MGEAFTPVGSRDGPKLRFLNKSRTVHVDPAFNNGKEMSFEDNWTDPSTKQGFLDGRWTGRSIFIEETPIESISSLGIEEFMDLDYITHKEAWDSLDLEVQKEDQEVSMVTTESDHLSCRISQAETGVNGGTE